MKRIVKIILLTIGGLLLIILGLWTILFEIPNIQQRSINDITIGNIDFYEKAADQIISNIDTLKIKYKRKHKNQFLNSIAVIPEHKKVSNITKEIVDRQKYFYIDSLLMSNTAYAIFINADSSIYFLIETYGNSAPGRRSYAHFVCFDPHYHTSTIKFLKDNDIVNQEEIKPNWTYSVIQIN
jgi:hypothetical protein